MKNGDRVIVTEDYGLKIKGKKGTIVDFGDYHGIEFDEDVNGHTCRGRANPGYGWNVPERMLKLIND